MKVTLKIEGITCSGCVQTIENQLKNKNCNDIKVSQILSEASFSIESSDRINSITKALSSIGYPAVLKDEFQKSQKKRDPLTVQLIICSLFTAPLLLHMFLPSSSFLNQVNVQLALCLPVYIIGILRFGKSAFNSLLTKAANMDVLIFAGSSAAFFYSLTGTLLIETSNKHHYLFYETSASIITLVLLGNFLEKRAVKQTTSSIKELQELQPKTATLIHLDNSTSTINTNEIISGSRLLVKQGEAIPTDGIIFEGQGAVDDSLISGEAKPISKVKNDLVIAGAILAHGLIKISATTKINDNTISHIEKLVVNAQENQPKIQRVGDKVSSVFVPLVLLCAIFTFVASWQFASLSIQQAIMSSIAVLVISCPCAMGLATPTAIMVGIGKAAKSGILMKGGDTLEKLATANTFIFDKTGTLSSGEFKIKNINCLAQENETTIKSIVKSLETHSNHPIALSLVKELSDSPTIELSSIKETKGMSIEGFDQQKNLWKIGSFKINQNAISSDADLFILKNNSLVAEIFISDFIKDGAKDLIQHLQKLNKRVILLSGDKKNNCLDVVNKLGINEFYFEQSPQQKYELIEQLTKDNTTVMAGDGINDAPALSIAHVGISFGEASAIAKDSSDVIILGKDQLKKVELAITNANQTLTTIKQNLFWALSYNLLAIPIAGLGLLSPIIAAVSMAFSDLIVIGNSIRLKFKSNF